MWLSYCNINFALELINYFIYLYNAKQGEKNKPVHTDKRPETHNQQHLSSPTPSPFFLTPDTKQFPQDKKQKLLPVRNWYRHTYCWLDCAKDCLCIKMSHRKCLFFCYANLNDPAGGYSIKNSDLKLKLLQ